MIDHIGTYGARVAEGLSASNVGLVDNLKSLCFPVIGRQYINQMILTMYCEMKDIHAVHNYALAAEQNQIDEMFGLVMSIVASYSLASM